MSNKYIFVDYEGTLSESPSGSGENGKVLISDLLFKDVFSELKPIQKVKDFLLKQNTKNIFVLGIIDTAKEIKQKERWLKKHYSFIDSNNYIFVSSEHKKVEIINEYDKNNKLNKKEVVFIDDKLSHLQPAMLQGYACIDVQDIK